MTKRAKSKPTTEQVNDAITAMIDEAQSVHEKNPMPEEAVEFLRQLFTRIDALPAGQRGPTKGQVLKHLEDTYGWRGSSNGLDAKLQRHLGRSWTKR